MMVESVLQQYGWEQGWVHPDAGSAATCRPLRPAVSGLAMAVTRGLAGAGLVIDSYARNSQARFDHVGFNILPDAVILPTYLGVDSQQPSNPAQWPARFIKYLLSAKGQAISCHLRVWPR